MGIYEHHLSTIAVLAQKLVGFHEAERSDELFSLGGASRSLRPFLMASQPRKRKPPLPNRFSGAVSPYGHTKTKTTSETGLSHAKFVFGAYEKDARFRMSRHSPKTSPFFVFRVGGRLRPRSPAGWLLTLAAGQA